MTQLEGMSKQILPNGMNIEWTDLSFQQATQGNTALIVFPVAVLLAFRCWRHCMKAGRCRWR